MADKAWFPVLEANQGFLSLLALALALGVALYEHIRAERAKYVALEAPARFALEMINELDALANEMGPTVPASSHQVFPRFKHLVHIYADTFGDLATVNPPSAIFAGTARYFAQMLRAWWDRLADEEADLMLKFAYEMHTLRTQFEGLSPHAKKRQRFLSGFVRKHRMKLEAS
jgi:hypothetical protein